MRSGGRGGGRMGGGPPVRRTHRAGISYSDENSAEEQAKQLERRKRKREFQIQKNYPDLDDAQRNTLPQIGLGARVWLLQGPDLVRRNQLNPELFFLISTYIVHCPIGDVQKLHHSFNLRLFNDIDEGLNIAIKNIKTDSRRVEKTSKKIGKRFDFFKSSEKVKAKRMAIEAKKSSIDLKRKDAIDCFEKRMKF